MIQVHLFTQQILQICKTNIVLSKCYGLETQLNNNIARDHIELLVRSLALIELVFHCREKANIRHIKSYIMDFCSGGNKWGNIVKTLGGII